MTVHLLTKLHFELLSLKVGCTGSSESTLAKMPHCWKSHVTAHYIVTCTNRETAEMSNVSQQLRPFSKLGLPLKERNSLPVANSFP